MNYYKNKYFKKLSTIILILTISITLWNCEKEEFIEDNYVIENGNNYISKINLEDSPLLSSIINELKKQKKKEFYNKKGEKLKITILKDKKVRVYKDSIYTTFTIAIKKENQPKKSFSNLVIDFKNNIIFDTKVITYLPSHEYLTKYLEDEDTPYIGKATYEQIDIDVSKLDIFKRSGCTTISTTYCNAPVTDGAENITHIAGSGCNPDYMWTQTQSFCFDIPEIVEEPDPNYHDDSSGGGGSSNGGNTAPVVPCVQDGEETLDGSVEGDCLIVEEEDKIYNELTGKADCVYNRLLSSGVANIHNLITELFIEFGNGNIGNTDLTFKMSNSLPDNIGGKTVYYGNGKYGILVNENLIDDLSSIEIAAILVHEISHAFLGKHYNDSYSTFSQLYSRYINDTGIQNYSHNIMKDQFINRMATTLKNYDDSILPTFDDYKILASQGVFQLTANQKEELKAVKILSRNNDTNCN